MTRYFGDMSDLAKKSEMPDLVVERVVGRMFKHEAYVLDNMDPSEHVRYIAFRGNYLVDVMEAMHSGEAPADIIWTLLHNLAHKMAAGQFKFNNGVMPTDDLWYPGHLMEGMVIGKKVDSSVQHTR